MSDHMRPVDAGHQRGYREPSVADDDTTEDEEIVVQPLRKNTPIYPPRRQWLKQRFHRSRIRPYQRQSFDPSTNIPNISSQTRIQFQASDVLRQLEPLPAGPFGPEHQLVIARNMARIQGVTADSAEERKEAEKRSKKIIGDVKKVVRIQEPEFAEEMSTDSEDDTADENEVWTPSGSEDSNEDGPGAGSRKRRHPDDDEEENNNDRNAKRARRYANPSLQIQPPFDISKLAPLPLRITYPSHPTRDRPDIWFITNFQQLYRQSSAFCSKFFSLHEIPPSDEPWDECQVSPEFIKWAEMVAEPEPRMGSWDELLRDRGLRKWFVMAVVVRVLRVKVFEEYLFGGLEEEIKLMHQVDRAFLGREGFQREELRAAQARTILGSSPVTANFYPSVANLTAKIALLLTPLITYLYSLPPPPNTRVPDILSLYQALHNLVSQAGYLSICVKLTPSIIQMYDVRAGDIWAPDDMHCLDEARDFLESKEVVMGDWRAERHGIRVARDEAEEYMRTLAPAGTILETQSQAQSQTQFQTPITRTDLDPEDAWAEAELEDETDLIQAQASQLTGSRSYRRAKSDFQKLDAMFAETLSNPPTRTHRALIKLSVWPVIRRYTPGSVEESQSQVNKPLHEKDGFRIFLVAKAGVVAYFGREETGAWKRGEEDGYTGLREWREVKEKQRGERAWDEIGFGLGLGRWRGVVRRGARNAVRASSVVAAIMATGWVGRVVDRAIGAGIVDGVGGWAEGAVERVVENVVGLMA